MPSPDAVLLREPFTIRDAERAGLTRAVVRRLHHDGLVRPVLHGVYVDSGARDTLLLRAAALAKVAPPGSVCCDRTAAWLHGVDIQAERDPLWLPPLNVFRIAGDDGLRRDGCTRGKRSLDLSCDVVEVGGVVVTTPLRTAIDLGRLLRRREAFVALNALARHARFGQIDLLTELPRFRGMRGVVQLRTLVAWLTPVAESAAESTTLLQLLDDGLPMPEPQVVVTNDCGIALYRLDFAYLSLMIAIEYDGEEWHSSPAQRERDEHRRRYLRERGWIVVVLTKEDVYGPSPRAAARVRAAIREAGER